VSDAWPIFDTGPIMANRPLAPARAAFHHLAVDHVAPASTNQGWVTHMVLSEAEAIRWRERTISRKFGAGARTRTEDLLITNLNGRCPLGPALFVSFRKSATSGSCGAVAFA
jgi:hypothetical protein